MNILLVDDNRYVLEGIREALSFKKLGIENVFMMTSAEEAKDVIRKVKIHIVLSDIEMPEQSGLELLEWINQYDDSIVTMFCTCYSDFNYAKKAIDLKCFSYYLKPINYGELEKLILSAVKEAEIRQKKDQDRKYVELWKKNEYQRKEDFFRMLLNPFSDLPEHAISEELSTRNLEYTMKDKFLISMLELNSDYSSLIQLDEKMQYFLIQNIATEIMNGDSFSFGCVFKRYYDLFVIIFQYKECSEEEIRKRLERFAEQFRMYISSKCCVFYSMDVHLNQIQETVENSISRIDRKQYNSGTIFNLRDMIQEDVKKEGSRNSLNWDSYNLETDTEYLIKDFKTRLAEASEKETFRRADLKEFIVDFRHIVYTKLYELHIEGHFMFADESSDKLYRDAFRSVKKANEYAEHVLRQAAEYLKSVKRTSSVVQKVKDYIDKNYCEDIRREDIGDNVYLDANYLSVIFKQEYGMPIHQYILGLRIAKAKELLRNSQESVSSIAQKVGYVNFSYFSTLFKEKTGVTPREYRKNVSKEKQKEEINKEK